MLSCYSQKLKPYKAFYRSSPFSFSFHIKEINYFTEEKLLLPTETYVQDKGSQNTPQSPPLLPRNSVRYPSVEDWCRIGRELLFPRHTSQSTGSNLTTRTRPHPHLPRLQVFSILYCKYSVLVGRARYCLGLILYSHSSVVYLADKDFDFCDSSQQSDALSKRTN